jgi:FAD/FMN-containing dehydrogenase
VVEPGITWEQLDRVLQREGLTLRLYPTSYPSSTVGGWLAQGGAGIGSYEFGYFRENVVAARLVLPSGEVRELHDADLDLVADAEGITGMISQVTLRVMPLTGVQTLALAVHDTRAFQALLEALITRRLPIWSMSFINPKMAEMKNEAPLREHHGHVVEHRIVLPKAYILTLAFRDADAAAVQTAIPVLAASYGA